EELGKVIVAKVDALVDRNAADPVTVFAQNFATYCQVYAVDTSDSESLTVRRAGVILEAMRRRAVEGFSAAGVVPLPRLPAPAPAADAPPAGPDAAPAPGVGRYSLVAENLMARAKAFEKSRRLTSALGAYQQVVREYPGTDQAVRAQARIDFLGAVGAR